MNQLVNIWNSQPRFPSPAHISHLHSFQRIIEIYESARVVKDLSEPRSGQRMVGTNVIDLTLPDLT